MLGIVKNHRSFHTTARKRYWISCIVKRYFFHFVMQLVLSTMYGQFEIGAEFRPRSEFRNGFGQLIESGAEPAFSISTRARLNALYKGQKIDFSFGIQDVLVWGENLQTQNLDVNNTFVIYDAKASLAVSPSVKLNFGRQPLVFDDERILGSLEWAQQGRFHDALLFNYSEDDFEASLGLAFNQNFENPSGFVLSGNTLSNSNFFSYKTLLLLHASKKTKWGVYSLLFLNNGFQETEEIEGKDVQDGVSNLQTFGGHMRLTSNLADLKLNLFFQTGRQVERIRVNGAFLASLDIEKNVSSGVRVNGGIEVISGGMNQELNSSSAFYPLFGTNHRFNGYMDYFYVGNFINSRGLVDIHSGVELKTGNSSNLKVNALLFQAHQRLPDGRKSLGLELDVVESISFEEFKLQFGYSHYFPSEGIFQLQGVNSSQARDFQNWAWVMLIFKPNISSN